MPKSIGHIEIPGVALFYPDRVDNSIKFKTYLSDNTT